MSNSNHKENDNRTRFHARESLPGNWSDPERKDLQKLWETSAKTVSGLSKPDAQQTEDALRAVRRHLALEETEPRIAQSLDRAMDRSMDPAMGRSLVRSRNRTMDRTMDRSTDRPVVRPIDQQAVRRRVTYLPVWIAAAAAVVLFAFGLGYFFYPQSLTASYGERVTAVLPDGSTVVLNSGTTIRYNRLFGFRDRIVPLDGEAFFTVAPGEHPFIVTANEAVVEVTGTSFNIRSRSDDPGMETRVHVASGSVRLYPAGRSRHGVSLGAGDWSRWNTTMEMPQSPEPAEPGNIGEWREDRFHFRSETLGMIFREMERRFDIRIELEVPRASSEVVTAHYAGPGDPERIIEDICHVKGLRYARTANGFRIYQ